MTAHPLRKPRAAFPKLAAPDETAGREIVPKPPERRSLMRPTLGRARMRLRHVAVMLSFFLCVLLPASALAAYLYIRSADQYASHLAFSVRSEDAQTPIETLLGSTGLSGATTTDTDILYDYLQSQPLVSDIHGQLDLASIWSRPGARWASGDPLFAYGGTTIEDLVEEWGRKVRVSYDSTTSLITVRVLAFDPNDAQLIARAVLRKSGALINDLSALARDDAIVYSKANLEEAQDRLRDARLALRSFRTRTQIIDPTLQTATQSGLISALENQLVQARIDRALLLESGMRDAANRVQQTTQRIQVIETQIDQERAKLGEGAAPTEDVADIVGEYEALQIDLEFAQEAFTAARASFDLAQAEARQKTRYLAAHIEPTLAESARFPQREVILGLTTLLLFIGWAILALTGYALRDRR